MAAFEDHRSRLSALGVHLLAASVDPEERGHSLAERLGLGFALGHSLPLLHTASTLGAWYEEERQILHATGFLVRPSGEIAVVCYSSGAIGRLHPDAVVRLTEHLQEPARSGD